MRRVAPHHLTRRRRPFLSPSRSLRIGAFHVGRPHAGPRAELLPGGGGLRLRLRTALSFDAFSSREPVPTSLENALEENDHDLRLFTRRSRLRGPAVLPDLRPAAARTVLTAPRTDPAQIQR